jgi:hypothetical protein
VEAVAPLQPGRLRQHRSTAKKHDDGSRTLVHSTTLAPNTKEDGSYATGENTDENAIQNINTHSIEESSTEMGDAI